MSGYYISKIVGFNLLLKFLFLSGLTFAQPNKDALQQADKLYNEANSFYDRDLYDPAFKKYQQAKKLYLDNGAIGESLVDLCLATGIIYYEAEKFAESIRSYQESVFYQRKITPQNDSSNFYTLLYIGAAYIDLNRYDSAYYYFTQAEQLLAQYPNIPLTTRLYNELGYLSKLFGNYSQSINYHEKALIVLEQERKAKKQPINWANKRFVKYNINIAHALSQLGRYREAVNKLEGLIKYNIESNSLNLNLASAYLQIRQPDSALTYLVKIKIDSIPNTTRIDYFNSLGLVYTQKKQYPQALFYLNKAQQISLNNFNHKNNRLAATYLNKAKLYEDQRNYPEAIALYQLAIQTLHFTFNNPNAYQNPREFEEVALPLMLFETLKNKAYAFGKYFKKTRKITDLAASLDAYELAFKLAERIRKGYDSEAAKLFLADKVAPTYEEAIATAFRLYNQTKQNRYLQAAFVLAEESKAAVLAESLRELEIKKVPGISPMLLQQEADLKRNNAALKVELIEETNLVKKEKYRKDIREIEIKLGKIYKELEKNKKYYGLKYDAKPVKISQLQQGLDNETAVVEYFIGKKHLYVFVVSRNTFIARQIGNKINFSKNRQELYNALYLAKPGSRYKGNIAAYQVYQQLVGPVAEALAGKDRLLIIPDKELCYLPFEALISEPNSTRYLIQDYTISYAYSAKLLRRSSKGGVNGGEVSVLAMAPFGSQSTLGKSSQRADLLAPLLASANEVEKIGGQVFIGKEATKERLKTLAENYDIIHLATHAKADNEDPLLSYIAFYQDSSPESNRLYVSEIYNLQLDKLKLVVLSACETGSGKLINGEGIMSLARAFAFAGCPSIITTLWQAEDKATAFITTRLHSYLKKGKPKDVAVRLAKLDYLYSHPSSRHRSPVYWANFIFIGDQGPVYPDYSWIIWTAGAILTAILAGLLISRRRKHNKYIMVKA